MPSAWMIADTTLQAQLQAYVDAIAAEPDWAIDLYTNDHIPSPDDTAADYTAATFLGYLQGTIVLADFGSVSVTAHVAKSINATTNTFDSSQAGSAQTVYGYYITDDSGDLVLAEMFALPIEVDPGDSLDVTPELRHTYLPS